MTNLNEEKLMKHPGYHSSTSMTTIPEIMLTALLFGSTGAITWAIRGTAGWGGVDGTVVPGLMWGILWYYLAHRKGIDARGIVLWLGLGVALGGELGYGQYTGWIRGIFSVDDGTIPINPGLGYFWFAMCGIGWAAPGGIILGWALNNNVTLKAWIMRILVLVPLLVLLFAWPLVDWLGEILLKTNSTIIFPNADLGIYAGEPGDQPGRTIYTNTQNFAVVVWWILALLISLFQKDRITTITGLVLGLGFGLGFMQSAIWVLGYGVAPDYIDWWKMWELNSGFNLGVLYAILFYWHIRQKDKNYRSEDVSEKQTVNSCPIAEWKKTIFLAVSGFILLYFVGFEYFFWIGLALCILYLFVMGLSARGNTSPEVKVEKRKNIFLVFSAYYLAFLLFQGGSENFGLVFQLYDLGEIGQYSWPLKRVLVFAPAGITVTVVALLRIRKIINSKTVAEQQFIKTSKLTMLIVELIVFTGFIGTLSIWPAKISIFYAFFLVLAIISFNRLEYGFNKND